MLREQAVATARARGMDAVPVYINGRKRCVSCNRLIPLKRIQARPDAVRCVACEEKLEKS
ncbi:MAG: TraR/DksA C4-type zinc finger protein [Candidatus Euphemobacter frigidus]|nr:TraR/DksA C4-type zinc finger protein [Candidatus Euphemobacter frigidus]